MNLSGNDTGDWVGTDAVQSVAVNPNDNLVYTGLNGGKFGVYNHSGTNVETSGPPDTGGGGNTPVELLSGFNVAPQKINVTLNQSQSKTECFIVINTGTLSVNANLNVVGEIIPYAHLTNSALQIPVGNSKTACAVFSAGQNDSGNYSGKIEVSGNNQKKYIEVFLEIQEIKKGTFGILPIDVIFAPSASLGILPIGTIFSPSIPIGILPIASFIPGPLGILPLQEDLPFLPPIIVENLIKAVGFISLWILLLLLLIIYLAIRRFIKLQDQLSGYKSREEKLAVIENLKRNSLRKESNFFEKIIDKGTIYLSEKKLEVKSPLKEVSVKERTGNFFIDASQSSAKERTGNFFIDASQSSAKEKYNSGAELYYKKDYGNALKEFQKSVELKENFWQGYQGIGNCHLAKGEIENAKKAFEKSLKINPKNKELTEWMGKCK